MHNIKLIKFIIIIINLNIPFFTYEILYSSTINFNTLKFQINIFSNPKREPHKLHLVVQYNFHFSFHLIIYKRASKLN